MASAAIRPIGKRALLGITGLPGAGKRLIITEGNYLLFHDHGWDRVRPQLDEVWYVDLDAAERLSRLIARHIRRWGAAA